MSPSNKPKHTYSAYVKGVSKMNREVTADWNGSPRPNWRNSHNDMDNNWITMGQTTPQNTNVRTLLLPAPRHPRTANGKYPHSYNSRDEGDDVQGTGFYDRSLLTGRSATMQTGHKTTGGVRLAPTLTNETFPAFEDDKEILDVQTADSFFATPQSSVQTRRARGDTNASQTSRIGHDEMSPFPSFTLPACREEHIDGLPPTRQQVLTLLEAEINAFNTKSRAKSKDKHFVPFAAPNLSSKVKHSRYEDFPGSVAGRGSDGVNGEGQVTNQDEVDEYEGGRENEKRKGKNKKREMMGSAGRTPTHTSTRRTTRSQPRSATIPVPTPLKKATVPQFSAQEAATEVQAAETEVAELVVLQPYRPNLFINLLSLFQIHLDAFPAIYAEYPTLRTQPWDILELRERLPPIEWNASFRLKLDIFVNCMDWVGLRTSGEIERKTIVGLVKDVVDDIFERQNLLGPNKAAGLKNEDFVLVVVRTIRLERVIDALREKFAGMKRGVEESHQRFGSSVKQASPSAVGRLQHFRSINRGEVMTTNNTNTMTDRRDEVAISSVPAQRADEWLTRMATNREKERSKLKSIECATYLFTWLWFLEAVPDEVLSSVDVKRVGRVFRTMDDVATVPSGPVVLMRD